MNIAEEGGGLPSSDTDILNAFFFFFFFFFFCQLLLLLPGQGVKSACIHHCGWVKQLELNTLKGMRPQTDHGHEKTSRMTKSRYGHSHLTTKTEYINIQTGHIN